MGDEQGETAGNAPNAGGAANAGSAPRVGEMFQQAVTAQLAEQRAQRESILEFSQRLEITERLMTEGLSAVAKVLTACDSDLGHMAGRLTSMEEAISAPAPSPVSPLPEEALARIEDLEAAIVDRLSASDATGRLDSLERRLEGFEQAIGDRLTALAAALAAPGPLDGLDVRLEGFEQSMSERLAAVTDAVEAPERLQGLESRFEGLAAMMGAVGAVSAPERLDGLETRMGTHFETRFETFEQTILDRLAAMSSAAEAPARLTGVEQRLDRFERAVGEQLAAVQDLVGIGVEKLSSAFEAAGGQYEQAVEDARSSREQLQERLIELEGSVRKFEEQTTEQLADLRDASTAAEAGILERIILESQTVATHFETVRPAVEAAAQAGPELETTLSELRELAERAMASEEPADTGPYSAEELLAPHEAEHADDPLFQPPEETKIPERRFLRRDR